MSTFIHEKTELTVQEFFHVHVEQIERIFLLQHVVRGIHKSEYAKLLTCVSGAVYDVVVDLRPESPTYLQWAAVELTEDNCRQLLIPPNCGHAFCSLSENSTVIYCQVSELIETYVAHEYMYLSLNGVVGSLQ